MSSYQNKSKEELIIELEKLQQLNNLLVSSHKKKEKKYDKEVQKLHKKDLLFRKLSANVSDLIFQFTRRTDGSYFVPIASEGIKNIFGCSPEDVLNDFTPIANVIYPEDAERVMNYIEYSAKYLTYFNCEYRVQLPGKEIQWISSKSTPEKLPDGSVTWYGFNANITERKKAEEKLKETTLLLQSSIESPKDMIILSIDKNYNYLYFNECHRVTMLYAYGQEVKIGMNLLQCITSEEDKIKAKINYDKALNGESHITIEEYGDIEKSYYETRYNPIFNDKNEIIGTTAFSADITERKKTEEQLFKSKEKVEESEARYRTLFENMNTGFVLFEVVENEKGIPIDLIILAANEGFEKTTGLNLKDAAGMNLTKVLPGIEKDEADWIGTYSKVAHTGESAQFEQGSELLGYYYSISAFYAGPKQCAVTFQDITERKQAEMERQKFALLVDSSSEFIGMCDLNLQPIYVNPSGIRMLGLPDLAEACRVKVQDYFFPEDQRFIVEEFFPRVLSEGEGDVEIRLRHFQTGEPIWMLYYLFRVCDDNGGPIGWATVSRDITERKQAQELMQEREYLLSSSQQAAHVGTWSWKIGDTKVYWSDETYRIYGLSPEMGAPSSEFFFEIIHPEDRPKMQEWPKLLIAGLRPPPIEFRVLKPDGIYRVIQTNGDVIETVDGVPTRIAGTAYDITERKQAEEKLRESESRFRKLYEDGANGMVMAGKDFKFMMANKTFCQMTGYKEEELQQLSFADITHPDDSAKDTPQVKKMMAGEIDVYRTEKRYVKKDGQSFWAQLTVSPINDSNGQFLYFVGIIVNVTERKNAELGLRESESRFRQAVMGAPFPIMIHTDDGQVVTINNPWTQLTGYEHTDIPTIADWTRKAYGNQMDLVLADIDNLFTLDGPKKEGEYTIATSSGDSRIWDFSSAPIGALPDGRRLVISMAMDITDRKNAELDLIRMSRIMKNSQEIAHLGSFEYVAADQTTIWSEEEYNIYGLDPNGPSPEYNVMLEKCIHPDDAKLLHDTFMTAIQNQEVYELEHRIVRPDGSVRWVYDQANPYFDEQGNLLRYVGATLDITERKLLLEELEILNAELEFKVKQRTAQLEASNKELEAFSYSVSHDLRAPLRHINGYVDLLNSRFKDELPEKAHHYLKTISEASSQMGILIDELLKYSRTGQKEVSKSALDFNLLLKEVLEEMAPVTEGRNITWNIKELPKVFGDYKLMKLVWVNLLDNAIKYTRNQQTAKISVGYKKEAKDFVFWVCDNGVGFDMKYAHKLFGVFQRLHSQTEFEGTGIGLANVQRIIHKHLGRVWAEAEPGKGAKFYFSLPINLRKIR